nr:Ig domain-containing protein [Pelovirga terrestris]
MEYRWLINGEEHFFETSTHLPGNLFKRGDVIAVEVTPVTYAGERLAPIVSRPFEAINAAPVITSEPPEELSETGFRYQVTATDPDGDALTFRLENTPEGMQINASAGLIQWNVDAMPEGIFPVKIIVDDGHGGQTEQSFELQLAYEEVQSP